MAGRQLAIYLAAPEVENDRRSLNISDEACIVPSDKEVLVQWAFEEMGLARQIASFEQNDPEEEKTIEYGFFFLRHLNVLVDCATTEEKALFLGSTFPEKFHFKDGKVRTNSDNPINQALFSPDAPK